MSDRVDSIKLILSTLNPYPPPGELYNKNTCETILITSFLNNVSIISRLNNNDPTMWVVLRLSVIVQVKCINCP